MSETDDTDVLLLIPPDFFLVRSSGSEESLLESSRTVVHKPPSCTAQVIGKLVDQVHSLESRLESLEISTSVTDSSLGTIPRQKNWDTDSYDSRFDSKYSTFPRRRRRKVAKKEKKLDFSFTSLDSISSRKSIPPLNLKDFKVAPIDSSPGSINDSSVMDGEISSIVSTPSKKSDKLLLHEIDEFLTKVDAYESPDIKYNNTDSAVSPESVIKATGDYISQKLDSKDDVTLPSGRIVPSSVLDRYIYLVKSNPQTARSTEKAVPSTSAIQSQHEESNSNRPQVTMSETAKTLDTSKNMSDTKSPSARRLNFIENKDVQPTSTPKQTQHMSYLDSFKPSSNKIYDRACKVVEQYKFQNCSRTQNSLGENYSLPREEFKMPQMRPFMSEFKDPLKSKLIETIDTDLLSLSELWGDRGERGDRGDTNRLEEERLKREHCEAMIQQLQKKVLDQQEKLAVAIKVDRAKDNAITKLREAWLKLTGSLDKTEERHRTTLEKMMREVENYKHVANEAQKKTNHFEAELYKALDLAHDYQEKCKLLTNQKKEVQDNMDKALANKDGEMARKDKEIEVLKDNYDTVARLNKQSGDCIKNLEAALEKEKSDHDTTKIKVTELQRKIQCAFDETSIIQQERDLLREKVNEERSRNNMLERQISEKHNEACELLKKCDSLESEAKTLRKHLELQKNELKTHYQKQLEDAVLAKLQEFQQQLDVAEREMENDARGKENAIVDSFNKQISRMEEQHKLEISVLEEKQKEEIKLYRLQLVQASEKIGLLENKLEGYRRRRTELAGQLHRVMEAQWRQALSILTHPHHNNNNNHNHNHNHNDNHHTDLDLTQSDAGQIPQDCCPPAASLGGRLEGLSDAHLQQYVKLLLTKPPALDGSGDSEPRKQTEPEHPTSDRPDAPRHKPRHYTKPPWKS